jgi:hypothetical protein
LTEPASITMMDIQSASSSTSPHIFLAATSSDVLYQLTDNINALVQQQLSGRPLPSMAYVAYCRLGD